MEIARPGTHQSPWLQFDFYAFRISSQSVCLWTGSTPLGHSRVFSKLPNYLQSETVQQLTEIDSDQRWLQNCFLKYILYFRFCTGEWWNVVTKLHFKSYFIFKSLHGKQVKLWGNTWRDHQFLREMFAVNLCYILIRLVSEAFLLEQTILMIMRTSGL